MLFAPLALKEASQNLPPTVNLWTFENLWRWVYRYVVHGQIVPAGF